MTSGLARDPHPDRPGRGGPGPADRPGRSTSTGSSSPSSRRSAWSTTASRHEEWPRIWWQSAPARRRDLRHPGPDDRPPPPDQHPGLSRARQSSSLASSASERHPSGVGPVAKTVATGSPAGTWSPIAGTSATSGNEVGGGQVGFRRSRARRKVRSAWRIDLPTKPRRWPRILAGTSTSERPEVLAEDRPAEGPFEGLDRGRVPRVDLDRPGVAVLEDQVDPEDPDRSRSSAAIARPRRSIRSRTSWRRRARGRSSPSVGEGPAGLGRHSWRVTPIEPGRPRSSATWIEAIDGPSTRSWK